MEDKHSPDDWSLTPLSRSLVDFDVLLESETYGPFFRSVETIKDLYGELRRLTKVTQWLYFSTFIGAILILSGPLPKGLEFSAVGATISISLIPQQLISLATAIGYGIYATHFASLIILSRMIQKVLEKEGVEAWQFFGARFDATGIWAAPMMPKAKGFSSPKRHIAIAALLGMVPLLSVFLHSITIIGAIIVATYSAFDVGGVLLKVATIMAFIVATTSAVGLLALLFVRMPFRLAGMDSD